MTTADPMDRVLTLLGDRDPIDVLCKTPPLLTSIASQHSPDTLRSRPYPDKWSPLEILGHLVDHEIMSMSRIRLVRFSDEPTLHAYDQERMVTVQQHNEADPTQFAQRFEFLRALNLEQYTSLTPAELERVGKHTRRGDVPLSFIMRAHAGHDLHHLDQIRRYLDAITKG